MRAGAGTGGGLHGQQHPGTAGLRGVEGVGTVGVGRQPQGVIGGLGWMNGGAGVDGAQQSQPGPRKTSPSLLPTPRCRHRRKLSPSDARQLIQGLGSIGGIGPRPPGKMGLRFDVILSRLQGEV
ncbi:hypothetical protein CVT25_008820 [Psilocybe cyanescens]|uniref:Uncharacterized protein n=1 Tax=Psilocybe cyanescens TaxID=93625 RepID=A0A409W0Z4_PSICY|nr:hypothetical protein CVT25_008820 [Psilocybe cyanescens]